MLPANPFPSPTNGKAVVMWQEAEKALNLAQMSLKDETYFDANSLEHRSDMSNASISMAMSDLEEEREAGGGRDPRRPSLMAGMVQAAMRAAHAKNSGNERGELISLLPTVRLGVTGARAGEDGLGEGEDGLGGGEDSPVTSIDDSDRGANRREMFAGSKGDGTNSSSKGMRQESYYLRGVVEAERDADMLATIAECIPGQSKNYGALAIVAI